MLKRINRYLKDFKKDLDKLQKYRHNITYGLDYLFNDEDDYHKPKEVKRALMVAIYYMKAEEMMMVDYQ